MLVSANGKTIVCPSLSMPACSSKDTPWTLRWLAYSTSAPAAARTLLVVTLNEPAGWGPVSYGQWISASGMAVIATWYLYKNNSALADTHLGVISNGFTRLPVPVPSLPALNEPGIAW